MLFDLCRFVFALCLVLTLTAGASSIADAQYHRATTDYAAADPATAADGEEEPLRLPHENTPSFEHGLSAASAQAAAPTVEFQARLRMEAVRLLTGSEVLGLERPPRSGRLCA